VIPNGSLEFNVWRPLLQLPLATKFPVTRSKRTYSYFPDVPIGCQPVSTPAQSSFTSAKPDAPFARTITRSISG
jgi:hypothetical protein